MVADIASDGPIDSARQRRRRSARRGSRGSSGAVDPAFAYDWVRRQTGNAEIRTVAVLAVGLCNLPADLTGEALRALTQRFGATVREIVEAHGGVLAPGPTASHLIAHWGTEAGREPDVVHALAAARAIIAVPELSEHVSAVVDAGPGYIEPGEGPAVGAPQVSALAAENALALQFTTRPGDIAVTPAADMLGRALEALPADAQQMNGSDNAHPSPSGNWLAPGAKWSAPDEVSIHALAEDAVCRDLLPGARAAIARAADGNPDLALVIGRTVTLGLAKADSLLTLAETPNPISLMINRQCDALGPGKFLLRAAAVCGEMFDSAVLADALDISLDQLVPLLDALVAAGLLLRDTPPAGGAQGKRAPTYKFLSRLVCAVVVASLPARRRRALHARIGEAMAALPHPIPETVARQFTAAGNTTAAIAWWRRAAERAIVDSAAHTAVAHLQAALTHVSDLPRDASGPRAVNSGAMQNGAASELARLLGPQLAAIQGNASTDVLSNYVHTARLGDRRETADQGARFDVLWGLLSCHLVRGEMHTASTVARRLMACAEASGMCHHLLLAHRMTGLWCFLSGRLQAATRHYAWVLSHYDARKHADLRFTYASDQYALANAHLAWTLTLAGNQREANAAGRAALIHAERLKHPHTTAHTVCVLAAAHMMARQYDAAMPLAMAGRAVAQKNTFPYWAAWSAIIMAGVEKMPGSRTQSSALTEAIESYKAIGATQALPFAYALLGERFLDAGQPGDAMSALDEGLQFSHASGVVVFDPNLLHLYGCAAQQTGRADFDAFFDRAEKRARRTGARLWRRQISASRFVTRE